MINYLIQLDQQIFLFVNRLQNPILDFLSLVISQITEGGLIWLIICLLIFIFDQKEKKRKVLLLLLGLLLDSWLVNVPIKTLLFCRERPFKVMENVRVIGKVWENCSFPSGHVSATVTALILLFYLYKIRQRWLIFSSFCFLLVLSFARIYVGMHYFTDILAGIIIGLFSVFLTIFLDKQIKFY